MSKLLKTRAFLLKKKTLLQSDELISLFTLETGKIIAIAKGVKKITSKRAPHIQTGNLIEATLMLRQERYYLQDTKLISGFYQLKQDQNKIRYLYTILFILDRLLPELEPEQRVFKLLQKFLAELTRQEFSNPEFRNYLQQLLTLLGYEHEQKPLEDLLSDVEAIIHQKIPRSII